MKNKMLLLVASLFFFIPLRAQTFKLDVEGDAKITGNLDISNSADNLSSLYIGKFAGQSDPGTDGLNNVGVGFNAMRDNTIGENNTALGLSTQLQNEDGNNNTSVGYFALSNNVSGNSNTVVGSNALGFASHSSLNTAIGAETMSFATTGSFNTAVGFQSMKDNTTGDSNTAIGLLSLQNNTTGKFNTAIGNNALETNTTGNFNTALGLNADVSSSNLSNATAIGYNAKVSQSNSLVLGNGAKVGIGTSAPSDLLTVDGTGLDNDGVNAVFKIISGNGAQQMLFDGNEIDAVADGIFMNNNTDENIIMVKGGGRVTVGTDTSPDYLLEVTGSAGKPGGGFWSNSSDRRLKKDIEDYKDGLQELLQIRPVWYRYNGKFGLPPEERYVGVIAQEIQEVAPYTVTPYMETDEETGESGEYLSYNGTAVTYMLVNAVQEQQKTIEEQQTEIEELKKLIYSLLENKDSGSSNPQLNEQATSLTDAQLFPNQPNPFTEKTLIRYYIPEGSVKSEIRITSLAGKVIKAVPVQATGEGQLTVNAQSLSAGTYLYSLLVDGELIATEKMVLTGKN